MVATASTFEAGAYTLAQIAALAEVRNHSKVSRWLFGAGDLARTIIPYYGADHELLSFIDLIQVMAIRDILNTPLKKSRRAESSKRHRGISLRKIRQTIDIATEN